MTDGFRRGVDGKFAFLGLCTLRKMPAAQICELRHVFCGVMLIALLRFLQEISFSCVWCDLCTVDS
jgi:hypothetical protein